MTGPLVDWHGVSFGYPGPNAVDALQPTDLVIDRGEYVAICGPSGSGKSTLLDLLGLLDRPTAGRYLFDGVDTQMVDESERATIRSHEIGFVFQSFHLVAGRDLVDNVGLALLYRERDRRVRSRRAEEALERVGLAHRRSHRPDELSGGERQRVAIARALVGGPQLILADEPTGNLDSATASTVTNLFEDLRAAARVTLVVVTHNPELAARAERVIGVSDGVVASADRGVDVT